MGFENASIDVLLSNLQVSQLFRPLASGPQGNPPISVVDVAALTGLLLHEPSGECG